MNNQGDIMQDISWNQKKLKSIMTFRFLKRYQSYGCNENELNQSGKCETIKHLNLQLNTMK